MYNDMSELHSYEAPPKSIRAYWDLRKGVEFPAHQARNTFWYRGLISAESREKRRRPPELPVMLETEAATAATAGGGYSVNRIRGCPMFD